MRRRGAFTLVELLVVVAIVSILMGLLAPALVGARRQAHTVACAARLRSIGQAMTMYTLQYGCYPGYSIGDSERPRYAIWPVRLRPFTDGNQDGFYCPAQDERCRWEKVEPLPGAPGRATDWHAAFGYELGEPLIDIQTYFSYGYNAGGSDQILYGDADDRWWGLGYCLGFYSSLSSTWPLTPREIRANHVRAPSSMIAVADSAADGAFDAMIDPMRYADRRVGIEVGGVHGGGANVLFCDGHVQWYPKESLMVTNWPHVVSEDPIRRMWNRNDEINNVVGW